MDKQAVYDRVVKHVRDQGEPSISEDGQCLYRGPNGLKCAAGCLVPDSLYHSGMEHLSVAFREDGDNNRIVEEIHAAIQSEVGTLEFDDIRLLHRLQGAHDRASDECEWDESGSFLAFFNTSAKTVAKDFNLKYSEA